MKLERLHMEVRAWGPDKGKVYGDIKFSGEHGSIELTLTEENCEKILRVIADRLVEAATERAQMLTGAIIEATKSASLPERV